MPYHHSPLVTARIINEYKKRKKRKRGATFWNDKIVRIYCCLYVTLHLWIFPYSTITQGLIWILLRIGLVCPLRQTFLRIFFSSRFPPRIILLTIIKTIQDNMNTTSVRIKFRESTVDGKEGTLSICRHRHQEPLPETSSCSASTLVACRS